MDILSDINKISYDLLIKEPFYGHLLVGLVKEQIYQQYAISVAPSDSFVKIGIEENYWYSNSETIRKGLIKHELLHITFKHPLRCKSFVQKKIAFLAADLIVNQLLLPEELPTDAFTLDSLNYFGFNLLPDKDLKYYYEALKKIKSDCEDACNNTSEDASSSCSNGNNTSSDQEKEKEENKDDAKNGEEALEELLKILEDGKAMCHGAWQDFNENSTNHNIIEHNIDALLYTVGNTMDRRKLWGNTPGHLKQYINKIVLLKEEKIDWRKQLRIFTQSSQITYVKNTISRPSKRYGTTPGTKIKRRCKLLLAIDTSASLSKDDITAYFHEIHHIWRKNAEVFIVECDTEITRAYKYKGEIPKFVVGRGGTDFTAPVKYNNDVYKGDAIIYFTDGEAPVPDAISRKPILWLVYRTPSKRSDPLADHLPGRVVYMDV